MTAFGSVIETAGAGIAGIHAFLELMGAEMLTEVGQQGCLLVNTSIELSGSAPGFEDFAIVYRTAMRDLLVGLVAEAQPNAPPTDPVTQQRVDVFQMFLVGVISSVRGGASDAEVGRTLDSMHALVDTWGD
jgi:hypothetical protein